MSNGRSDFGTMNDKSMIADTHRQRGWLSDDGIDEW